ncbi:MAG: hypothetical protein LBL87_02630 [Ruminococcus sp.]|jgi:hypothetical protein|nr:hypothetical protein [Ruminococcus sp.]
MSETEKIIKKVNATMAMEGMPLTETDVDAIRAVLNKTMTASEMKAKILSEYGLSYRL